jgi:hypothetical protein
VRPLSRRFWLLCASLVFGLAACARSKAPGLVADALAPDGVGAAFAGPTQLRATLLDGARIALAWKHNATEAGGAWIEFATPGADFVKLDVAWPETTTFTHPDLVPSTTFLYRLVPFFGRPSATFAVTTGPALPEGADPGAEGPLENATAPGHLPGKSALRSPTTIARAAPANLTVALSAATSAELRWEDRAADEDGYLVELSTDATSFKVCALLPADATSFRKIDLPPRTRVTFRVRAFFLGSPSQAVAATTAAAP